MKLEVKKYGYFSVPAMAPEEADTYCLNCQEVLIFDKPAAAGVYTITCPFCSYINKVVYRERKNE